MTGFFERQSADTDASASARNDVAGGGKRLDDGIIGVALVAVLFQHALAFKARRGFRS